jgi:hypothetical protein
MKITLKLCFLLTALGFLGKVAAQDTLKTDSLNNPVSKVKNLDSKPVFTPKLHFGMDFGAGYIVGSGFGSGSYTTWAPSLCYTASRRLTLQFTGVLSRGPSLYMQNRGSAITLNGMDQSRNGFFLYTAGQYALTPKITITGSVYKTLNSDKNSRMNPYALDLNGADFGLNYKISKNFSVGAQIRYANTNSPFYLYNNYMNPVSPWNTFNRLDDFPENGF